MRRTLTACRVGLTAAAAFVLLTACGGGSGNNNDAASSSTSETTSSSADNSAPQANSEFCTQAQALIQALESAFSEETADPGSVAQQFQQTADAMRTLDPPAEISDDWETLAGGLEQFAKAFADFDPTDPAKASAFEQQTQQLQGQLTASGANVEKYLTEQCGIDTENTESATPTS
jgi:hypothetical protein